MKKCTVCKTEKDKTLFYKHPQTKDGLGSTCKPCEAEGIRKRRAKNKRLLIELFGGKCSICGYDKCVEALDFDHIPGKGKSFNISRKKDIKMLIQEASRCQLLCANCHREVTEARRTTNRK
jgi:hypothetical protein